MSTWISYLPDQHGTLQNPLHNPSIQYGSLFYLLHPRQIASDQIRSHTRLLFLAGCFGLGGSHSQERHGEFCWGLTQSAENHEVKQPSHPPLQVKISLPIPQGRIFGNIFPASRKGKDLHVTVGCCIRDPSRIFMCSHAMAGMPLCRPCCLQVFLGVKAKCTCGFVCPHSGLAGFC